MTQRFDLERQEAEIVEEVRRLVRENRATIDEIHARVKEMGGTTSRSAVGRYVARMKQDIDQELKDYRAVQSISEQWLTQMEDNPKGDVGSLVRQMVTMLALHSARAMQEEGEAPEMNDVALLARAMKDLAAGEKISTERVMKVRQATAREAAERAVKVAKKGGMSADTVESIKREILGIAT